MHTSSTSLAEQELTGEWDTRQNRKQTRGPICHAAKQISKIKLQWFNPHDRAPLSNDIARPPQSPESSTMDPIPKHDFITAWEEQNDRHSHSKQNSKAETDTNSTSHASNHISRPPQPTESSTMDHHFNTETQTSSTCSGTRKYLTRYSLLSASNTWTVVNATNED